MLKRLARKIVPLPMHVSMFYPRYLKALVRSKGSSRVMKGPFSGMKYIGISVASVHTPKLLGTYEQELHDIVRNVARFGVQHVIDIGAAEGYYAVGLAYMLPEVRVTAFETEKEGRDALAELALINGVQDRVQIEEKCEKADLVAALGSGESTVVVCDVEGYEDVLLDPAGAPALARSHILVELHEFAREGLTEDIRARFAPTHDIVQVWQEPRTVADFPFRTLPTRILPRVYVENEVNEFRCERMSWFWMEPRQATSETHG